VNHARWKWPKISGTWCKSANPITACDSNGALQICKGNPWGNKERIYTPGVSFNRPLYLIQLKFLLSSNTVHRHRGWSMQIATRSAPRQEQAGKREGRMAFAHDRPISGRGFTVSRSGTRTHTHGWDYTFPRIARLIPAKFVPIRRIISRDIHRPSLFPRKSWRSGKSLTLRKEPEQKDVSRNSNVLMARIALPLRVSSSLRWSPVEGSSFSFFFLLFFFRRRENDCSAISVGGRGHKEHIKSVILRVSFRWMALHAGHSIRDWRIGCSKLRSIAFCWRGGEKSLTSRK